MRVQPRCAAAAGRASSPHVPLSQRTHPARPRRHRRRRLRRPAGGPSPAPRAGRRHADRPAQLPPLPAAAVSGGRGSRVRGRDRPTAAEHLPPPAERQRRSRRGLAGRSRAPPRPDRRRRRLARGGPVRHADRGGAAPATSTSATTNGDRSHPRSRRSRARSTRAAGSSGPSRPQSSSTTPRAAQRG